MLLGMSEMEEFERRDESGRPIRSGDNSTTQCCKVPRVDYLFLFVLVLLGALVRLDFMRAGQFVIDADEAIVGLMAKHMLEGAPIPTFYYGQHYMGSLEPMMVAFSFALFGISSFTLQLPPLLCSLVLIVTLYFLGREFGGARVGRVAALLATFPPVGLIIWGVKARGGFIEILLLGALALLVAARWWKGSATSVRHPVLLGLILGLGFWTNNQIIYFIGPISLYAAVFLLRSLIGGSVSLARVVTIVIAGTVAFFVGSAPFWRYNIGHDFPSFGMFGIASWAEIQEHAVGLFSAALPILLGAKHFWELETAYPFATPLSYVMYGVLLLGLLVARREQLVALLRARLDFKHPVEMLLIFVIFSCTIFVISTYGWLVQAPRYLLPIYVGLFVLSGYVVERVGKHSRAAASGITAVLLLLNILSAYAGGRAVPGEPVVFEGQRVSRDHSQLIATLDRLGITHVRTNYWIGYRLAFETNERVTFTLFGAPYQVRIPEYQRARSPLELNQTPILVVPAEAAVVREVLSLLGTSFTEVPVSGYVLFHALSDRYPVRVVANASELLTTSGWGGRDSSAAVDSDNTTRWGTGAPQTPGQTFRLEFKRPHRTSGFMYELGPFLHDYPRGLIVTLETARGGTKVVLDSTSYEKAELYLRENRGLSLLWPAEEVRAITLTQTKSDPVFDWSIAELHLYEPAPR